MSFSEAIRAINEADNATKTIEVFGAEFVLKKMSTRDALAVEALGAEGDTEAIFLAVIRGGVVIDEKFTDEELLELPMALMDELVRAVNDFSRITDNGEGAEGN